MEFVFIVLGCVVFITILIIVMECFDFSVDKDKLIERNAWLAANNDMLRDDIEKVENKIADLEDKYLKTYEVMVTDNRPYSNHDTIIYKAKAGSKSEAIDKVLMTYYRESGSSGLDITTLAQVVDMEDK